MSPDVRQSGSPSMLRVAAVLLRSWRLVVTGSVVAVAATFVAIAPHPRHYTVRASFVPQSQSQSDISSLAGGLSAQLGLGNLTSSSSAFGSADLYKNLLQTQTILGELADSRFEIPVASGGPDSSLADFWKVKAASPALRRDLVIRLLGRLLKVTVDPRIQLVEIEATTTSPPLSKAIVERALDLVSQFNQQRRQSQSAREAEFIGGRLEEARQDLHAAEDSVARFVERNRDFKNAPFLTVQYERLQRDVLLRQSVYSALSQRYEQSRIEEVRDTPVLSVVEQPAIPVRPDSRHLALKLPLAMFAGAIVSMLVALWRARLWGAGGTAEGDLAEFERALDELWEDLGRPLRRLTRRVKPSGPGSAA